MAIKTEPFGQNIADAINQLSIDAVKITGITNKTIVNDSAYGFVRSISAFGKTEQLGIPTPTEPKALKYWDGLITSRKWPRQEAIGLGFELHGIRVDEGGNYTDAEGQQWLCDTLDMEQGIITRNLEKVTLTSSGNDVNWKKSSSYPRAYYSSQWAGHRGITNTPNHIQNRFTTAKTSDEQVPGSCYFGTALILRFADDSDIDSLDKFLAWIDANPLDLVVNLAAPVEEPLTQEQKNKLLQIRTYNGGTIFDFSGATPFFEIGYWLGNQNGQALADMDAKINQLLIR